MGCGKRSGTKSFHLGHFPLGYFHFHIGHFHLSFRCIFLFSLVGIYDSFELQERFSAVARLTNSHEECWQCVYLFGNLARIISGDALV